MLKLKELSSFYNRSKRTIFLQSWALIEPIVEIEGVKIYINRRFSSKMQRQLRSGWYEIPELEVVKTQLCRNDTVMEIGAGLGLISSYCAKHIGSERVFAYEANPALELYICNTYKLNNVSPQLEICLVGKQTGESTFYVENHFWTSSTIQQSRKAKAIRVPVKSFNQEVQKLNPSFLIIDIEGGEYELSQYGDFYNVQKILVEVHEAVIGRDKVEAFKSKLAQLGFQLNERLSTESVLFFQRC